MTRRIVRFVLFALPLLIAGPALAGDAATPSALPDAPAVAEVGVALAAPDECRSEGVDLLWLPAEDLGVFLAAGEACRRCPYYVGTCEGNPYCYVGNDCCCPSAGVCNCVCW